MRGAPTALEVAAFAWLIAPILLSWFLSRTGRYEGAHVLSSLALASLVMTVAMTNGGIESFAAVWLVVVPLEAALSRCAIVANDIPSFREVWGDTALYFETNDADSLADAIRRLNADRQMCRAYANLAYARARDRFTTKRMIDDYLELYRSLSSVDSAAA